MKKTILLIVVLLIFTVSSIAQQFIFKSNKVDTWIRNNSGIYINTESLYDQSEITFEVPYIKIKLQSGTSCMFKVNKTEEVLEDNKKVLIMECENNIFLTVDTEKILLFDYNKGVKIRFTVYNYLRKF